MPRLGLLIARCMCFYNNFLLIFFLFESAFSPNVLINSFLEKQSDATKSIHKNILIIWKWCQKFSLANTYQFGCGKKKKGNWLCLILVGFWYVAASEREVIAILKLISQTARNFPGVFYNGKAGAILPVIGRILPFFAEPAFRLVILLFYFLNFPNSICSR